MVGTVKWFDDDKGFGFIGPEDGGKDVFVHFSQIEGQQDPKTLTKGARVTFDVESSPRGLRATKVRVA